MLKSDQDFRSRSKIRTHSILSSDTCYFDQMYLSRDNVTINNRILYLLTSLRNAFATNLIEN